MDGYDVAQGSSATRREDRALSELREKRVECPTQSSGDGDAASSSPRPVLEAALKKAVFEARMWSGDALLHALYAGRVIARLREVAPELVAAAEDEVYTNPVV